jgi:hypothetical protein
VGRSAVKRGHNVGLATIDRGLSTVGSVPTKETPLTYRDIDRLLREERFEEPARSSAVPANRLVRKGSGRESSREPGRHSRRPELQRLGASRSATPVPMIEPPSLG